MSSDIPQVRRILNILLSQGALDKRSKQLVQKAIPLTYRAKYKPEKAKPSSTSMTPELRAKILNELDANPEAQTKDIASKFDVNPGRVSDCLRENFKR